MIQSSRVLFTFSVPKFWSFLVHRTVLYGDEAFTTTDFHVRKSLIPVIPACQTVVKGDKAIKKKSDNTTCYNDVTAFLHSEFQMKMTGTNVVVARLNSPLWKSLYNISYKSFVRDLKKPQQHQRQVFHERKVGKIMARGSPKALVTRAKV